MSRRSSDSALVVDLDGVLRIWDPEIVSSAERRAGLPPGALDRAASADAATLRAVVTGRISDARWRAGIATRLVAVHGEAAAGAVAAWSGPCGEVDRRVLAVLREQRRSRPVALLSNATDRLPRDLQRLGLDDELDAVSNSSAPGRAEPDPEVFVAVCSALGLPPDRCVLVDDQQVDVDAAARVGLRAHFVQRSRRAGRRPAGRLRLTGADGGPGWTRARSRPDPSPPTQRNVGPARRVARRPPRRLRGGHTRLHPGRAHGPRARRAVRALGAVEAPARRGPGDTDRPRSGPVRAPGRGRGARRGVRSAPARRPVAAGTSCREFSVTRVDPGRGRSTSW